MSVLSSKGNIAVPAQWCKQMTIKGLETVATAMRPRVLAKYIGVFCLSLVPVAAVPGIMALVLGEFGFASECGIIALVLAAAGLPLARLPAPRDIQQNEAMAVTAMGFVLGALAMVWPFAVAGMTPLDALFESVSAITTTGLSAAGKVEGASRAFLFTRAWMQWYGGLGIIVLAFALVLGPGARARRLALSETSPEDLIGGTRRHGRRVLVIYGGLTLAGGFLLWALGATPFDAAVHALASLSTGGFSSHDNSVAGAGGSAVRGMVSLLCLAGSISFTLQYQAWRSSPMTLLRDGEVRTLVVVIFLVWGTVMFSEWLAGAAVDAALAGNAAFMAVSAQTTSGFQTVDPASLAPATKLALVFSMAVGGDVGSTAGGLKILRLLIVIRLVQLMFAQTVTPRHAVVEARIAGRSLDQGEIGAAGGMVTLYAGTILLSWFAFLVAGLDPLDSLFDVVSAIGTVGLSTGVAGPELATPLKLVLCLDMLMGRLEILAILVFAYPRNWIGPRRELS